MSINKHYPLVLNTIRIPKIIYFKYRQYCTFKIVVDLFVYCTAVVWGVQKNSTAARYGFLKLKNNMLLLFNTLFLGSRHEMPYGEEND